MVIKMSNISKVVIREVKGGCFLVRGRRVNDERVVERPEVKFDYNFMKYSSCVKMTVGIGRRVVHIIFLRYSYVNKV